MHASNMKSWTSALGDYQHPEDLDYAKKYEMAKNQERGLVNKLTVIFSLVAIGAAVIILELITRV